jgi:glycosyltransferase involved in cell wall biosynthesis
MRILMVHNSYQQRGGEDESTEQDIALLRSHGHEVYVYQRHNDEIDRYGFIKKAGLFLQPTWSRQTYSEIKGIIQHFQPDITHVQNFFPLISPAVHYASRRAGVPVVQSLHNYRLLCANGLFFRDGGVCEQCLHGTVFHAVQYGCYRGSRLQTLPVVNMQVTHRLLRTWDKKTDAFIALTEFSRKKFIEGGLAPQKIHVRPHFLKAEVPFRHSKREFALFVGRLTEEKGLQTLIDAWRSLPQVPLKIAGDGPLHAELIKRIEEAGLSNVELLGRVSLQEVLSLLNRALFLVMPSIWYETFGRTMMEAYAAGTPVIVSRLGAMQDLVEDHVTGLLFEAGDQAELVQCVRYALENESERAGWSRNARDKFEKEFSSERAYQKLMEVYQAVTKDSDRSNG